MEKEIDEGTATFTLLNDWFGIMLSFKVEGGRRNGGIFGMVVFVFPSNCWV